MRKKAIDLKKIMLAGALALVGFFSAFLNSTTKALAADFIVQETPFIFQNTAGDNISLSIQTEDSAQLLEKRGYSIVYNQLNDPDNFTDLIALNENHIYLYRSETTENIFEIVENTPFGTIYNENDILIDLTIWYGGNEYIPTDILDYPEEFSRNYQGDFSYSLGEIRDSNGRYMNTIGRQQWDEEWELGGYDNDGNKTTLTTLIRNKNPIRVLPGVVYYFYGPVGSYRRIIYDENMNLLSNDLVSTREAFTIPSNAYYLNFNMTTDYGTTYKNDVTISLFYDSEIGYKEYYRYEVLSEVDTGEEVLRSVRSVYDYKLPSGEIVRNIGVRDYEVGDEDDLEVITDYTTSYYVLSTPTYENGTSFSEDLDINYLGSMFWTNEDFNGIPQANRILYNVPGTPGPDPEPEVPEENNVSPWSVLIFVLLIIFIISLFTANRRS